jgi:creatinine amidohydrolase
MKLESLTWPEVKNYLRIKQSVIIPAGTCEQHGEHLPLNTDTLVAEYISDYLSDVTGVLVAPNVNYGVNLPCDRFYSGTTSVTEGTLKNYISNLLDWWGLQGFKRFYIVTAHGDPIHLKALKEISPERVSVLELYDLDLSGILEKQKTVKHACEGETSVMLHLFPDKVCKDKIKDFETPFEIFKDYLDHAKIDPIEGSPGCEGYPSFGSAEKGEKIINLMKKKSLEWMVKNN